MLDLQSLALTLMRLTGVDMIVDAGTPESACATLYEWPFAYFPKASLALRALFLGLDGGAEQLLEEALPFTSLLT